MYHILSLLLPCLLFTLLSASSHSKPSSHLFNLYATIIKDRSLDDFKKYEHNITQLTYTQISDLKKICTLYSHALDIMRELKEHPEIEDEMKKVTREQDEPCSCFHIIWYLIAPPDRIRQQAMQLAHNRSGIRDALEHITDESTSLSLETLIKKVIDEKERLTCMNALLQREQNKWICVDEGGYLFCDNGKLYIAGPKYAKTGHKNLPAIL